MRRSVPLPGPFYLAPSRRRSALPGPVFWFFVLLLIVGLGYTIF
jgi:hypothetical protein